MNVAFIPVRGGSKSIPLKNIKPLCGKPLVFWVIKAACKSSNIDKVIISTDSDCIKTTVNLLESDLGINNFKKIEISDRSSETASDTASTESAMLEFANKVEFENIILIQATSPLLNTEDIDKGFKMYFEEGVDSVLSVVPQKRFLWQLDSEGNAQALNYDFYHRPRRQEFSPYYVENGAFYITSRTNLLKTKSRISGSIKAIEMEEDTFFEIDELNDWIIIEALMNRKVFKNKSIPKIFLTDCDGCLTDGGMYYSEKGDELKKFNTKDGMGFSILKKNNILTGIVTSEKVELNRRRAEKLRLDFLIDNCDNKLEKVQKLCEERNISLKNAIYVGDDINDIELLKQVGYSCCPSDANEKVKSVVNFITDAKGGEGVIREIVDKLLREEII